MEEEEEERREKRFWNNLVLALLLPSSFSVIMKAQSPCPSILVKSPLRAMLTAVFICADNTLRFNMFLPNTTHGGFNCGFPFPKKLLLAHMRGILYYCYHFWVSDFAKSSMSRFKVYPKNTNKELWLFL